MHQRGLERQELRRGRGPLRRDLRRLERDRPAAKLEAIRTYHQAFPDLQVDVEEVVVGGNTVVVRSTVRGTDTGGYAGRGPTGRAAEEWVVNFMRFEGDRCVSEFIGADKLGLFIGLGVVDDPWQPAAPARDRGPDEPTRA